MARVCKFLQWIDPTQIEAVLVLRTRQPFVADHRVWSSSWRHWSHGNLCCARDDHQPQSGLYISDYLWLVYIICKMFCSGMYNHSFAPKHIPPLNVFTDTNHFGGELKNMMPRFCCIFMWVRTQELWYLGVKQAQSWDSDSSVFKLCEHHVGQNIDI